MRTKSAWLAALLATSLLLTACGGAANKPKENTTPEPSQTPTQEETRLVIYTARDKTVIDFVVPKFEEKYPEYKGKVEVLTMGAQQIMERVRAEKENPQGDIWWGGTQQALSLAANEGLLASINPSWGSKIADGNKDKNGQWYGEILLPEVIMYNSDMLSKEEVPQDWDDLIDPKWDDQILIRAVPASGTMRTIYTALIDRFYKEDKNTDRGYDWLMKLDANTKEYAADPTTLYLKMARQEGSLSLWNLQDILIQKLSKDMPFDYAVPKSGAPILVDGVAVVKDAKHPQAADKFLELLFSAEVQGQLAKDFYQIPTLQMEASEKPAWLSELEPQLKPMDLEWDVMANNETAWIEYWDQNIKGKGGN